jgi:hypothetical protein
MVLWAGHQSDRNQPTMGSIDDPGMWLKHETSEVTKEQN